MSYLSIYQSVERSESRGFHDSPPHDFYDYYNNHKKEQKVGIFAAAIKNFVRGFSKIFLQKPRYYEEYNNYNEDENPVCSKGENVYVRYIS